MLLMMRPLEKIYVLSQCECHKQEQKETRESLKNLLHKINQINISHDKLGSFHAFQTKHVSSKDKYITIYCLFSLTKHSKPKGSD